MIRFFSFRLSERPFCAIAILATTSAICLLAAGVMLADEPDRDAFRGEALSLLKAFEASAELDHVSTAIASATTFREIDTAALPLTLATIGINPEARVKIVSAPDRIEMVAGRPRRFLVRIENLAGVTAPLRLRGLDLASSDASEAEWLRLRFVDAESNEASLATAALDGATDKYLAVELHVAEPGVREIRLVADAGQGTQDLGFRAVADVQIRTSSGAGTTP